MEPRFTVLCNGKLLLSDPQSDAVAMPRMVQTNKGGSVSQEQETVVKAYKGSQSTATAKFQADVAGMAAQGYTPASQSWAPGAYGCGSFIFALLLCFVLIGFLIFVYMLIVKPEGTLTVTYTRKVAEAEKTCPKCVERVKAAASVCRFCGHEFPPESIPVAVTAAPRRAESSAAREFGLVLGKLWVQKWFRYVCIGLALMWAVLVIIPSSKKAQPASNTVQSVPAKTVVAAAAPSSSEVGASKAAEPAVDQERQRVEAKRLMAEISARTLTNEEKLKGFYANPDAVKRANEDALKVATIALTFSMSKEKADQQIASQARQQSAKVSEQARVMYASSVEEIFVKNGMDAKVRAGGSGREQLTITYALMSQPLVYKFQNEMDLPAQAKTMGFKRLILTNGFESSLGHSWTIDLMKK